LGLKKGNKKKKKWAGAQKIRGFGRGGKGPLAFWGGNLFKTMGKENQVVGEPPTKRGLVFYLNFPPNPPWGGKPNLNSSGKGGGPSLGAHPTKKKTFFFFFSIY